MRKTNHQSSGSAAPDVAHTRPRFDLGAIFITPGAADSLDEPELADCLHRHHCGDWGDMNREDKQANERSLMDGSRVMSAYRAKDGEKFWIITSARDNPGETYTTILLPEEY